MGDLLPLFFSDTGKFEGSLIFNSLALARISSVVSVTKDKT